MFNENTIDSYVCRFITDTIEMPTATDNMCSVVCAFLVQSCTMFVRDGLRFGQYSQ